MRAVRIFVSLALCLCLTAPAFSASTAKHSGSIQLSKEGGLGRLEIHGDIAAVLQRDEGIVTLLSLKDPDRPKVLGRYDDDANQSLDGDIAFSSDGRFIFYARQTVQFSLDGIHVIDVSDPKNPKLAGYAPGGGAFRVATYNDGTDEWVVLLDAVTGLVVYRFEPTSAQLVPVYTDPLPATDKVGGPASAGLVIDPKDEQFGGPVLYVATGGSGLQIYDFSDPTAPLLVGSNADEGIAEIEIFAGVLETGEGGPSIPIRFVFAATEYWFDKTNVPTIVVYDASDLSNVQPIGRLSAGAQAKDEMRIQGMTFAKGGLYVAHSSLGLVRFGGRKGPQTVFKDPGRLNPSAGVLTAPYAFDVETAKGRLYVTDAATGTLSVLRL
ncbi:MAG: hypothetical protein QOG54_1742 [Actinomycetota bacterium]|jgi:hypothetical protein|nr:hypothetical protein [Actinomycetota bacterium]